MSGPTVEETGSADHLFGPVKQQILALDAAAREVDGVDALNDQVRLDLANPHHSVRHLIARWPDGDSVVGYGQADLGTRDAVSAHLVVAPPDRHRGVGTALLASLAQATAPLALRVWAHGNTPAAQAFAVRHGFRPVRELRQMRRALDDTLPSPTYDPRVTLRTFVPGADDEAWVAVNAASFSSHPEQGRLTVDDLRQRIDQPWFDPAGFFLVERDGRLLGYHWTKVHETGGTDGGPIAEVYVLGVHPDAQGLGLGKSLTLTGLHHLLDRGLKEVMLYVDSDNSAAVSVYERLGFAVRSVDVMYAPPPAGRR